MINVILLSGYLGSGKTTLIRKTLSRQSDNEELLIITNDFGKASIDNIFLGENSDTVDISGGCICCTGEIELQQALIRAARDGRYRTIIIEASGISRPGPLVDIFHRPDFKSRFNLTVFTAVNACRLITGSEPADDTLFYDQVTAADHLVFTHTDLCPEVEKSLKKWAIDLYPPVTGYLISDAQTGVDLLNPGIRKTGKTGSELSLFRPLTTEQNHFDNIDVHSFTFSPDTDFNWYILKKKIRVINPVRMKAIIRSGRRFMRLEIDETQQYEEESSWRNDSRITLFTEKGRYSNESVRAMIEEARL